MKHIFAGVVTRLTVLVTVTLVVSMLVLLALVSLLVLLFWHRKQQNKQSSLYLQVKRLTLSLPGTDDLPGFSSYNSYSSAY
jgi:hypothetical protein